MSTVEFNFKGINTVIQCNKNEKMKDIFKKFSTKVGKDTGNLYFVYDADVLSEKFNDLTFTQIEKKIDKERKKINLLAYESLPDNEKNHTIKSKEIICPQCGENCFMSINNYKMSLSGCKKGHKIDNMSFDDFEKSQIIDESKIICNNCKQNNKLN